MKKLFTFLLLFVMLGVTNGFAQSNGSRPDYPFTDSPQYYEYNKPTTWATGQIGSCISAWNDEFRSGSNFEYSSNWTIEYIGGNITNYTLPTSPIDQNSKITCRLPAITSTNPIEYYANFKVTFLYKGETTVTGYFQTRCWPRYDVNNMKFTPASETNKKTTATWTKSLGSILTTNSHAAKTWTVSLKTPTGYTEYNPGDYSISSSGVFTTKHAGTYTIRCTQDKIWNAQGMYQAGSAEYEITLTEDPVKWDKDVYYTSPNTVLDLTLFNNMGPWGIAKSGDATCAYDAGTINWGGYAYSFSPLDANHENTGMYPYRRDMMLVTKPDLAPGVYTIKATRVKTNAAPYTNFVATATIVVQYNNTLAYNDENITSQQAKTYTPTPRTSNSTAPISYTYKNNNTGTVTATLPTAPGVYTVTATQAATGNTISDYPAKEVTFTVTVTAPIIADTEETRSWKVQGDKVPVEHEYYVYSPYTTSLTFNINSTIGLPASPTVQFAEVTYRHDAVNTVRASNSPTSGTLLSGTTKTATTSSNYNITPKNNNNPGYVEIVTLKLYMSNGSTDLIHVSFVPSGSLTGGQKTTTYTAEPTAVQLDRTFAEGWNTLCLPFDLTRAQFEEAFGTDAKIYAFTDVRDETNTMLFSTVTVDDGVKACTPYLMHLVNAVEDPGFDGVIPIDPSKSPYSSSMTVSQTENGNTYKYVGNVLVTTINTNTNPGSRYLTASGNLKTPTTSGMKMKGMRAYFIYPAAHAGVKAAQMSFVDDSATSISELIESGMIEFNDSCEYSINGQRVNAEYKGIVIRNGKKYLRK